jgi:5-methylcytosine-specific restriction protein B
MNTADKSLANIDLALRRRFDFEEMPPKYDLLMNKEVHGVNIGLLLKTINQRIEVLIDRDHLIGHSYMLSIDSPDGLKKVFEKKIIPLLQEYFYDNWERIRWVLNDHMKQNPDCQFIREGGDQSIDILFGSANDKVNDHRFYINQDAFDRIESYSGILSNNE